MTSTAVKHDAEKARLDLLPFGALEKVGAVFGYGAKKYSDHNYRNGMAWSRLIAALLRHTFAFARGEDLDPESGHHHLAHAGCCVLMLLDAVVEGHGADDRWKGTKR